MKKLQRRIANYRGVAPDASLVSPTRTSIEDARHDSNRTDADRIDAKVGPAVVKRKYRRHPKVGSLISRHPSQISDYRAGINLTVTISPMSMLQNGRRQPMCCFLIVR